jgi:predicted aminopeptidase
VRRGGAAVLALAGALALAGCGSVLYVARGGLAEARILWRRQPIATLLAKPDLAPALRERLELVLSVRRYAEDDLGLRVGDSFETYADVENEVGVWVVSAARRDRLEAHTWWFPVVGYVPYKGFFERASADAAARELEAEGLDVEIRPASTFSTLGWFADPLLSTTVRADPVTLAETVFHELFHATLYLPNEAPFNESAANFVGNRAAIAFFCGGPGDDARRCTRARANWELTRAHGRLLGRYVRRLLALYDEQVSDARREARRRVLAVAAARELVRRKLGPTAELSPPNNAHLLGMVAYETELDTFDRLAPGDEALGPAIRRLVTAARTADDPFTAVRSLPVHDVARKG